MPVSFDRDRRYTIEEYFRIERDSLERHEYIDGRVYPVGEPPEMPGCSINHSLIVMNIGAELRTALKGGLCRVFDSSLPIRIPNHPVVLHPDISIICGEPLLVPETSIEGSVTNPLVIVEVLSPSIARFDLGDKFHQYRELASLQEYVVVWQHVEHIDVFFRSPDGTWIFTPVSAQNNAVRLRSLSVEIALSEIYAGVTFPPTE